MNVTTLPKNTQAVVSGNNDNLMLINESTLDSVVICNAKSHFNFDNETAPKWSSTIGVQAREGHYDGVSIEFKVYDETNSDDNYLAHDYIIDVYQRPDDVEANIVRIHRFDLNHYEVDDEVVLEGIEDLGQVSNAILAHIRTGMSSEE